MRKLGKTRLSFQLSHCRRSAHDDDMLSEVTCMLLKCVTMLGFFLILQTHMCALRNSTRKLKTTLTEEICLLVGGYFVFIPQTKTVHHSLEFLQQVLQNILCVCAQ